MAHINWPLLIWMLKIGECLSQCRYVLVATSSVQNFLSHKDYNRVDYPNNMNCSWLIEAETNYQKVILIIKDFDLNPSDCKFDYIKIYDGTEENDSNLRGTLCGRHGKGQKIESKINTQLLVLFRTDGSSTAKGFKIFYHADVYLDLNATLSSADVDTLPQNNTSDHEGISGRIVLRTETAVLAVAAIALVVAFIFLLLICGFIIMRRNNYCLRWNLPSPGQYYIIKRSSSAIESDSQGYSNLEFLSSSNISSSDRSSVRVWTTNSDTSL